MGQVYQKPFSQLNVILSDQRKRRISLLVFSLGNFARFFPAYRQSIRKGFSPGKDFDYKDCMPEGTPTAWVQNDNKT